MSSERPTTYSALLGLAALLVLLSGFAPLLAPGARYETWHCYGMEDRRKELVMITLIRHPDRNEVAFRGLDPQPAHFEVSGADRTWYFPKTTSFGHWRYRFAIEPDGIGLYFDLSRSTEKPVKVYRCRMES